MSTSTTFKIWPESPKRSRASSKSSPKSSPKRKPLHARSNSSLNELSGPGPTIRMVIPSDAQIYSKSPFPSNPSQIFRPRNAPAIQVFQDKDPSVSELNGFANAAAKADTITPLVHEPAQPNESNRASSPTNTSDTAAATDKSPLSPLSSRHSATTAPSSPATFNRDDWAEGLGILQEANPGDRSSTIRPVIPSTSTVAHHLIVRPALVSRPSESSLASSASSDTIAFRKHEDRRASSNPTLPLPPPVPAKSERRPASAGSSRSRGSRRASTTATPKRTGKTRPKQSSDSLPSSIISYGSEERPRSVSTPSTPSDAAVGGSLGRSVRLQYPVVKPPSASRQWADSRPLPKNPSRMNQYSHRPQWSSALSTIPSESDRNSRNSQHMRNPSQSIPDIWVQSERPRRRATIASTASSGANESPSLPNDSTVSFSSVSQPQFSDPHLADGRDSDERQDTVGELQSPQLKAQRSANFSNRSMESLRPSSGGSLVSIIPAWARSYYSRGERGFPSPHTNTSSTDVSDASRLGTAQTVQSTAPSRSPVEGSFPLGIFNPRRRLRQGQAPQEQPAAAVAGGGASEASQDTPVAGEEVYVVGGPRPQMMSEPFTPRLTPDRRSQARLSAWRPPSLEPSLGSLVFSSVNMQITMFCVGFIFPLAWIIAAFLPLPAQPELSKEATRSQLDVERALELSVGPMEQKRYLKAKWWRNLNRIMTVFGLALIGAIIAVAVVESVT